MTRTASGGSIEVHGLDKLNRAVDELARGLDDELRNTDTKVAERVKDAAVGRAYSVGGVAAHVAPTLSASGGSLEGGGDPAFGGAEFGGQGRPTTMQFKPYRGSGEGAGYFMFPAIRAEEPNLEDEYRRTLERLIDRAGLG